MGFMTKPSLPTSSCTSSSCSSPNRRTRPIIFCLLFLLSFSLIFFLTDTFPRAQLIDVIHLQGKSLASFPAPNKVNPPRWLEVIHGTREAHQTPVRVGLVNFEDANAQLFTRHPLKGFIDSAVTIDFEPVSVNNVTWKKLFPEWIHEDRPGNRCPRIPMPEPGKYSGLDVVVAQLPCRDDDHPQIEENNNNNNNKTSRGKEGIRDVQRLQINLATARLVVENEGRGENKDVYAVFVGKCEPMVEIFRCEDLVWHEGEYWVYKPNVEKLRELISMPVGTCALAHPFAGVPGSRQLQANPNQLHEHIQLTKTSAQNNQRPRHAYVTVLHSSEDYVCGAIALALSIRQTNSTKDLVILADHSISDHSISGLQAAGWKIKRIERIRSPHAKVDAYNEWNYSKLRVWQLTEYDKVMFIDADFIVLHNIDHFFDYPQLSASPNNKWLFNSGIMILEPSQCFFDTLMSKRYDLQSYNGGDQGYLNEVVTWWHRLTKRLNFMKFFPKEDVLDRSVPKDQYTIHFLGTKPWKCYRDYDCNWDRADYHRFASDAVNERWWQVYDAMSMELQAHCGMTQDMDTKIRRRRGFAKHAKLSDGHWKIDIKDPRQFHLVSSI